MSVLTYSAIHKAAGLLAVQNGLQFPIDIFPFCRERLVAKELAALWIVLLDRLLVLFPLYNTTNNIMYLWDLEPVANNLWDHKYLAIWGYVTLAATLF